MNVIGSTEPLCRCGFLESRPCRQFSVCASLNDLDHIRKVETEAPKVLLLDSSHDLWVWLPTVRGHTPILLPGLARLKGTYQLDTDCVY